MSIFQLNHCHGENVTQKSNWTIEFFAWADETLISAEKLPRDEETLLSQIALNLSFCKLTQLPESLGHLTHLTELDLAYNELTQIPEWIDNFTVLEKLDVSGNSIMSLPDSLRHLPNLEVFGLDKQIKKIGENVELLPMPKNTDFLDEIIRWAISSNIKEIPTDKKRLWEMTSVYLDVSERYLPDVFWKLTNLTRIEIFLDIIPKSIGNLKNLTDLTIQYSPFTKLPESIGNLVNLKRLNLFDNNLTELPESIGNLVNLEFLDLDSNELKELPKSIGNLVNLKELNLSNNNLTELPESIGNLTKLQMLNVSDNELVNVPYTLAKLKALTVCNLRDNPLYEETEIWLLDDIECVSLGKTIKVQSVSVSEIPKPLIENNVLPVIDITPNLPKMKTYQQKILFGSPGTGKSYKIDKQIISNDLKITNSANVIKTVFHPEYTYGDFVGKLMPITVGGNVQYKFYEGHFLKALSQAYKNIIAAQDNDDDCEKVALVIDEINRGNSAAIFGTIFQLLDREPDGWSSYEVSVNEIIFNRLFELCDLKEHSIVQGKIKTYKFGNDEIEADELQKKLNCHFENRTIKIPPNLSILASMNTSDSSIYYMDSAFKRRWEWEFIDVDSNTVSAQGVAFENRDDWIEFVSKLNAFIKSNHKSIRGIEDKQIGHFFITDEQILKSSIQNKLMFFLWDSVFNRDKKPLVKLLFDENTENELITFGDFAKEVDLFIDKINNVKNV
jgi:5-methylcytosine-specific restriction protein B